MKDKTKYAAFVTAASLAALLALGGCGGQSGAGQSSASAEASASSEALIVSSEATVEPEPTVLEIGKDAEGSLTVTFTNEVGAKITDIAVVAAETAEEDVAYLMEKDQTWGKGEDAIVHFPGKAKGNFDVYVKTKKSTYVMHNLAIGKVDAVTLRTEDGVGYATFKLDGSEVSSLSDELALIEQQEAEAAAAEAAAEEPAPAEDEYMEQETYYEEEPAQTEDSCIEGGVQLR